MEKAIGFTPLMVMVINLVNDSSAFNDTLSSNKNVVNLWHDVTNGSVEHKGTRNAQALEILLHDLAVKTDRRIDQIMLQTEQKLSDPSSILDLFIETTN